MKPILLAVAALTLSASAQTAPPPAAVFPVSDLHARLNQIMPGAGERGSNGATLADYGSYKIQLSVRTISGGAEVHAHWDDVMTVEQGSATLITGGAVVDGKTGDDGETHGSRIDGGQSRKIHPGDVLTIRAGTPHQLILAPGAVYSAVVIKIHEP